MNKDLNVKEKIKNVLKGGDILFIVPPFINIQNPALGVHTLQTIAEEKGFKVEVLYLNALLASLIGPEKFEEILYPSADVYWRMMHERLFARSAYNLPRFGNNPDYCYSEAKSTTGSDREHHPMSFESDDFNLDDYIEIEEVCYNFVEEAASAIASSNYKIIGCTQTVGQVNSGVALINKIKEIQPNVITACGGSNCLGEMAEGIASLSTSIDYVFADEAEISFGEFLDRFSKGNLPTGRVIPGIPLDDLNQLTVPDYSSFFNQIDCFLEDKVPKSLSIIYETCRGCRRKGNKKCFFCSERQIIRQKDPQKVKNELEIIHASYPDKMVVLSDLNIPDYLYKDIIPDFASRKSLLNMSFLTRVTLELKDIINFKKVGLKSVFAGIESFSTSILELVNKGTNARQNIQFLRYLRSVKINLDWLLLWGFPEDTEEAYQEILRILPLIRHLQPPLDLFHLLLVRNSPFLENREKFKINNVRPWNLYNDIYPEWADIKKLGYWYTGKYPCGSRENSDLMKGITKEISVWNQQWENSYLTMIPFQKNFLVIDNRGIRENKQYIVDEKKAKAIMVASLYNESEFHNWALQEKLGVLIDSWYVPLITASPELLIEFEA